MSGTRNWIKTAIKHPGLLKRRFPGVAKKGFSVAELNRIKKSNPKLSRQVTLTKTLKKINRKEK